MIGLESDYRQCFAARFEYLNTRRQIMFTYTELSERQIVCMPFLSKHSTMRVFCCSGDLHTERKVSIETPRQTYYDYRIIACGWGDPPAGDRWCTYIPGAQTIISITPVVFSIRYRDDKYCFCSKDPIDTRTIICPYQTYTDKECWVAIVRDIKVHTPEIHLSVKLMSEKVCYIETLDRISQRSISIVLQAHSEKSIYGCFEKHVATFTSVIDMGVLDYYTQRWCECVGAATETDRYCWMMGSPHSDRHIALRYQIYSDRSIALSIHRMRYIHEFAIIPATPTPSDRYCYYLPIIYYSEIQTFVETREKYDAKTPNLLKTDLQVYSNKDNNLQTYMLNERSMEVYSDDLAALQHDNDILKGHKVTIATSKNTYNIATVDNTGAQISSNSTNVQMKLKHTTIDELVITVKE